MAPHIKPHPGWRRPLPPPGFFSSALQARGGMLLHGRRGYSRRGNVEMLLQDGQD